MKKVGAVLALLIAGVPWLSAAEVVDCSSATLAAEIQAIVSAPGIGRIYTRDGAADGTIADVKKMSRLASRVDHVLQCGPAAAPLLVARLDDPTRTSAAIDSEWVPVGFICLDLLTVLVERPSLAMDPECETDGLCACYTYGSCFDPGGNEIRFDTGKGVEQRPSPTPSEVKRHWEGLLANGHPQFSYPAWYEARYHLVRAKARYVALGYDRLAGIAGRPREVVIHTKTTQRIFVIKVWPKSLGGDGVVEVLFWVSSGQEIICDSSFKIDRDGRTQDGF